MAITICNSKPRLPAFGNFTRKTNSAELYFHRDQHTAILVLESSSLDAARETLASLPLVRAGLIEFELTPLIPYTGFVRLYASRTEETKTGDILAPTINTLRLTLRPFTLRDDWVIGGSD